jgi:16S rRNA (guanine(527)-N(7))-methyltransferase RsmG
VSGAIGVHRRMLQKWRGAMDLVGPGPLGPHFEDAIGSVEGLDAEGEWADLGSGAGFPGIALAACWPNCRVFLVESRQKRAVFLRRVLAESGLQNASVLNQRTENLEMRFDGVISRAYKPPVQYLEDAANLCRPGGRAVLLAGGSAEAEIGEPWSVASKTRYSVGDGLRSRWILIRE